MRHGNFTTFPGWRFSAGSPLPAAMSRRSLALHRATGTAHSLSRTGCSLPGCLGFLKARFQRNRFGGFNLKVPGAKYMRHGVRNSRALAIRRGVKKFLSAVCAPAGGGKGGRGDAGQMG